MTHNLLKTETQKITHYQNFALETKKVCEVNNVSVHPFIIPVERVVTNNFLKYLENIGLTKNVLRVGQNTVLHIANVSYSTQISRTCPLTLVDRVNFLPLTEPNPTDNPG